MGSPGRGDTRTDRRATGYFLAVVGTAAGALVHYALGLPFPDLPAYISFYPGVVISAAVGGWGAGILATFLSAVAIALLFLGPGANLQEVSPDEWVGLALFAAINAGISILGGWFRAAWRAQRAQAELLRTRMAAVDATVEMVVITDREGNIQYVNPAFTAGTGYTAAEVIGQNPRMLKSGVQSTEFYCDLWQTVLAGQVWRGELINRRKDGTLYTEEMTITPVRGPRGDITDLIAIKRDVTQRRLVEQALRHSQADLNRAQQVSETGSWRLDVRRDDLRWSDEVYRIFEIQSGSSMTYDAFLAAVHADDREFVDRKWNAALHGQPYDVEHRIIAGGKVKWVRERAELEFDAQGSLVSGFGTVQDITRQKRQEQELAAARTSAERAKIEADRANAAKDRFLAVLSHELRTPLTPVLATIGMLQREPGIAPALREDLDVIRRNAELEARLIDDLLDVTRIVHGKVVLDRRPVNVCTVLRQAIEVCQADLEARRLRCEVDADCPVGVVEADSARLQQVFWNLLKNAIKFTPADGHILIRCRREKGAALIEVQDSGVGIEPEALGRIFDAFEQAERTAWRRFGGLGLGLAISKTLVEMHGGSIEARSEGTGRGAIFSVRLPLSSMPEAMPRSLEAAEPPNGSRKLRILLVEDHGDTLRIVARLLALSGHQVSTACDVGSAIDRAAEQPFDLLISDLGLPDGSGVDLVRQLRQRGHVFPAIAMTGFGQEEDVRRTRDVGFVTHLTKPVAPAELERAVADVAHARLGT
jgi:two-component system CheB/CheR fusion protein